MMSDRRVVIGVIVALMLAVIGFFVLYGAYSEPDVQAEESAGLSSALVEPEAGKVPNAEEAPGSLPDSFQGEVPEGWEADEEDGGAASEKLASGGTENEDIPEGWTLEEEVKPESSATQGTAEASPRQEKAPVASAPKRSAQPKQAESPAAAPQEDDGRDMRRKLKLEIDYKSLAKDPGQLGFKPDARLFRDIYSKVRSSYVEPVSDQQLFKGIKGEVAKYLKACGVNSSGLNSLDQSRNVLAQLHELYGQKVNQDVLNYTAIQGMLVSLNDPFSLLMTPKEYNELGEQVQSKEFGGIGVIIEADRDNNNQITVFEPLEGTPAAKAGLEAGDQIMAIDGKSTKGISIDLATKQIRGALGSKVTLKIKRPGTAQPFTVSITRDSIHAVSTSGKMIDGDIAYVRLRQFGQLTAQEFNSTVSGLLNQGARGMIFDLRNNGGGYVDAAVDVVGQFVPSGSLVVYTVERGNKRNNYNSRTSPSINVPVVVLINRFSASAAEITAGALRDHKVAALVGERSFGKGCMQQVFPCTGNSALKLTIARFYSPAGTVIDFNGLEPDYNVEMEPRYVSKEKKDIQLNKALEVLKKRLGQ